MSQKKRHNRSGNNKSKNEDSKNKKSKNTKSGNNQLQNNQSAKQPTEDDPNRPRLPFRTGNRSNTKRVGERSEAAFLDKVSDFGFGVARPWGDSERYDFILDNGLQLIRVQIKCTDSLRAGAYETRATYTIGKRRAVYTKRDIDFLAGHVVPLDIWYVMPVEVCTPQPMLRFYPHRKAKRMRLEKYKEAWRQLEAKEDANAAGTITIQAAADETHYAEDIPGSNNPRSGNPGSDNPASRHGASAQPKTQAQRGSADPWQKPVPWPIPRLQILFNRKPKP